MKLVIVFDLDDTLYEELSFVRSGFRAVSFFLVPLIGQESDELFRALVDEFAVSRSCVFDRVLERWHKKTSRLIKRCLSIYRSHTPDIALYPSAIESLRRLHNYPLYLVTDGNQHVQRNKVKALQLAPWMKHCFFTYAHGRSHSKPSPYCFQKICQLEGVEPQQVVYIADNPNKDFIGIKPLGFHTIRVTNGPYGSLKVDPAADAEISISSLDALTEPFLEELTRG